jgi:hypothetical protein
MAKPQYLFVFDDLKHVFFTSDAPTGEDLELARCGTGVIVRVADFHFFSRDGEWRPMREGILGASEVDERMTPPFHAPAEYFDPLARQWSPSEKISGGRGD